MHRSAGWARWRRCWSVSEKRREAGTLDVELIFKVAAVGIIVSVLHLVLTRAGREEQAMLTTLAGLIVVLTIIVKEIANLFSVVKEVFGL